MPATQSILTRLGRLFRRNGHNLPVMHDASANISSLADPNAAPTENQGIDGSTEATPGLPPQSLFEPRGTFLRPWAKRDQAINQLQEGFHTLTDLMIAVKSGLEASSRRQDELLGYLSHLPQALQSLPEASRVHQQTLEAVRLQLEHQSHQQETLAEILRRMSQTGTENRQVLNELGERVEALQETDRQITSNITSISSAMEGVGKHTAAGAAVLEQMRDNLATRDDRLEHLLHRQGTRFATLVAIAILIAVAALTAVCIIGYLLLTKRP
jgi:hypothetical protein